MSSYKEWLMLNEIHGYRSTTLKEHNCGQNWIMLINGVLVCSFFFFLTHSISRDLLPAGDAFLPTLPILNQSFFPSIYLSIHLSKVISTCDIGLKLKTLGSRVAGSSKLSKPGTHKDSHCRRTSHLYQLTKILIFS